MTLTTDTTIGRPEPSTLDLHTELGPEQPDPHLQGWTGALDSLADHIAAEQDCQQD